MTGLDSSPSLSQIPLHAHLTLLITCFLHTRAGPPASNRVVSPPEYCAASLSRLSGLREIRDDCRPNVLHKSCVQCDSAVGTTDYFCFLRTRLLSLVVFLLVIHLPPAPHLHIAVFRVLDPVSTYTSSLTRAPPHHIAASPYPLRHCVYWTL
jgi:hypothetical protein